MTEGDVRDLLRRECERVGSQKAWAAKHDLSGAYVNDVLHERREIGESILKALKVEKITTYRRIAGEKNDTK